MWARYHLTLAVVALAVGAGVAVADGRSPGVRRRALGAAGLAGALLGGWGSPRGWPWLVAAALLVVAEDRPEPAHPLGRLVPALTVVSLAGVWAAVPDTEPPLAAALVLLPSALLRAARGTRTGVAGTAALVVAVLGAVWVGSAGWGAALASAGAVGAVAVAPAVARFGREWRGRAAAVVVAAHLVVALVVPRLVMRRSPAVAAAAALAALAALGGVAAVVAVVSRVPTRDGPPVDPAGTS